MDQAKLLQKLEQYRHRNEASSRGAAVLIPLLNISTDPLVLLEVRAASLPVQPGEVCLPGGHIEPGENPKDAAIRETCEELLVSPSQIEVIGSMGAQPGPGGQQLYVYVGTLNDYEGSFSSDEVERTFTLPLEWLATHKPRFYEVSMQPEYPQDFPWELVPNGKDYAWRTQKHAVPFYHGTNPVVWGATARILARFLEVWEASEDPTPC